MMTPKDAWTVLISAFRQNQHHLHQGMSHLEQLDPPVEVMPCECEMEQPPAMGAFERYLSPRR